MNYWDTMRQAMAEARKVQNAADNNAEDMAEMLVGRLRRCRGYTLKKLKRELRNFNMHTGRWND